MGRLAVVGGHSILATTDDVAATLGGGRRRTIEGARGSVSVLEVDDAVILQRHGLDRYSPAHRIDHAANVAALASMGCDRIVALSSVGSLRPGIAVGTVVVPDDFIALDGPSVVVREDGASHVVPGFTPGWREHVLAAWHRHDDGPTLGLGVYWQTNGPRFETPAEVRYLATFADVVGMTVGSECVVACELGLDYAAVCVVDNLANGLGDGLLTNEEFEAGKAANVQRVIRTLGRLVPDLVA